ncbi:phenylalanine--tRNA ligase subunit beta [Candidatus Woesearchaeota archaeon]|nr:phenylalanine--tRNA ligase subunit beta [Candidatus Woesearchaeota archaeon]
MPTIEISKKDFFNLIGKKLSNKELEEDLMLVKGELESVEGDVLKIEIADTNRPDLWSTEGIAREIRTKYKKSKGISFEKLKSSGLTVKVNKNLQKIRPMTVCAVIRNLKATPEVLSQLIQLQEKVCETFGNKRREAAIGVYDLHKIKGPIDYKAFKPNDIKFIPLEFTKKLNLNQILRMHPKGKEYAHLLEGCTKYPIFIDSAGEVLSMPPVINSDYTGKVTEKTRDVFIECSGFSLKYLMPALNIIVTALVDRGGQLETVEVVYSNKKIITPNLKLKKIKVDWKYIEKRMGLSIGKKKIVELLKQANYSIKDKGNVLELEYSSIRQDIMHPVDVVEDVTIRYGYNNIEPRSPELITEQKMNKINSFSKEIANILVGANSQEILSYTLINKNNLIKKMNLKKMKVIEVDNPVSKNWSVFRTGITPCLMEFLSKNTNKEYPQQIFEIGEVVLFDKNAETRTKNPTRVAWAKAGKTSDFTEAKQVLDFLMRTLGLDYSIEETKHDSFIKGRVGRVFVKNKAVAYIGEINPEVLSNFGIDMPVCTFELNLTNILNEV